MNPITSSNAWLRASNAYQSARELFNKGLDLVKAKNDPDADKPAALYAEDRRVIGVQPPFNFGEWQEQNQSDKGHDSGGGWRAGRTHGAASSASPASPSERAALTRRAVGYDVDQFQAFAAKKLDLGGGGYSMAMAQSPNAPKGTRAMPVAFMASLNDVDVPRMA